MADGQLGDGSTTQNSIPVQVTGLSSGVRFVSAGVGHTCAIHDGTGFTGRLSCWGDKDNGRLGIGSVTTDQKTPRQVTGLPRRVRAVSAGGSHTCAIYDGTGFTGRLRCWGYNANGQLGNNTKTEKNVPTELKTTANVTALESGVRAVSLGSNHTCAIMESNGELKCWGKHDNGRLGISGQSADQTTPAQVIASGVRAVSAGDAHTCAIHDGTGFTGRLSCWGESDDGRLGLGSSVTTDQTTPQQVIASGVTAVLAGASRTCAIHNGVLKCSGSSGLVASFPYYAYTCTNGVPISGFSYLPDDRYDRQNCAYCLPGYIMTRITNTKRYLCEYVY